MGLIFHEKNDWPIYLSMGFGRNSVACDLMLYDQDIKHESVFCDTGCEWPETYTYIKMYQDYLKKRGLPPVTIINAKKYGPPAQRKFHSASMYDFYLEKATIPSRRRRDCSTKFKIEPKKNYFKKPCWNLVAIHNGETKRVAKWKTHKGIEDRFPLIEEEIDQQGCEDIIVSHNLPLPPKSACWFCFNGSQMEWRKLRTEHPNLWCKALTLERVNNERRKPLGLKALGLAERYTFIEVIVGEYQAPVFEIDELPPCQCEL